MVYHFEGSRGEFLKVLVELGEEPAFIARGLAPQIALDEFIRSCRTKRDEMLEWPKRHYADLHCRVGGEWIRLKRSLASDEEIGKLKLLQEELSSERPVSTSGFQTYRSALRRFIKSAQKFNKHWTAFLDSVSLDSVNKPRRDYNDFYLIEKGCVFDWVMNENDFVPLEMINRDFLWQNFPLLDLPERS